MKCFGSKILGETTLFKYLCTIRLLEQLNLIVHLLQYVTAAVAWYANKHNFCRKSNTTSIPGVIFVVVTFQKCEAFTLGWPNNDTDRTQRGL